MDNILERIAARTRESCAIARRVASVGELEERIHARVQEYMDRANHEYYLREQIHAIQDELGEDEDEEIAELRSRIRDSKLPPAARENVEKEIARAEGKLSNQGFLSKAPQQLVEAEKAKLETNKAMLVSLDARIEELKTL